MKLFVQIIFVAFLASTRMSGVHENISKKKFKKKNQKHIFQSVNTKMSKLRPTSINLSNLCSCVPKQNRFQFDGEPCVKYLFLDNFANAYFQKLDGYKFPVYSTDFCPRNQLEWEKRSTSINCNATNGYMCVPNENFTELIEFCYIHPFLLIQKGK